MRPLIARAALTTLLALAACGDKVPLGNGQPPGELACNHCHGTTPQNPAPPRSVDGITATTDRHVGAHQKHLSGGLMRTAIACTECHKVPKKVDDPGHQNGVIELLFGPLAWSNGAMPMYDRETASCSTTYCHGATVKGGTNKTPRWTVVDGTQAACGTCHGNPPALPHPQRADCNACHSQTVKADGTIDLAGGHHIDGTLDLPTLACSTCHGNASNAAPPQSAGGLTATTEVTVGAHQTHLKDGASRAAVDCTECHVVPKTVDDPGHIDASPAEVVFGPLATRGGVTPDWDRNAATCSNVYCHGAKTAGGTNKTPQWTKVDGTQAACGTCHGKPPPFPHPVLTDCSQCHPLTVRADGTIDIAGGHHIDGTLDVKVTCASCHGNASNNAPPHSTSGGTATTDIAVGAHQAHLLDGAMRKAISCTECHIVPATVNDPGHIDNPTATVTFGALSTTGGLGAQWDRTTATCSNVYCHGPTTRGGSNKTPQWTLVDGSQAACGTCHGNPPPSPHPQLGTCNRCHPATVKADGTIDTAGGKHVDGVVDVTLTCGSCHGSGATNFAPPISTTGATATTDVGVGAHQSHVVDGPMRQAVACNECHPVPNAVGDPGHRDGTVDVAFGTLAKANGASPSWSHAQATCSNVYCHGDKTLGGTNKTPQWTLVDGSQAACGTCHGNPPAAPHPQQMPSCFVCHPGSVQTNGQIDIAGGKHINGTVEQQLPHPLPAWSTPGSANFHGDAVFANGIGYCTPCHGANLQGGTTGFSCDQCHQGGAAWRTNCTYCHGGVDNNSGAPPYDSKRNFSTLQLGVGAHTSHVGGTGGISSPVACNECHAIPTDVLSAGHVDPPPAELTWGPLATSGGAVPVWNRTQAGCSASYCHGNFPGGKPANAPTWNRVDATQAACGTCHLAVPTTGSHAASQAKHGYMGNDCTYCHLGETNTAGTAIAPGGKALHVNGAKDVNMGAGSTWDGVNKSCAPACHAAKPW
jgi:predicted CxxxxCH...CXXCH cytochrome family protein